MFETITSRLSKLFGDIRKKSVITEDDISLVSEDIREILIDADVSIDTVDFIVSELRERALGLDLDKKLSPSDLLIKTVSDIIRDVLSHCTRLVNLSGAKPHIFLMVGLQGSGKTTSSAKLASYLKRELGKVPLLLSLDIYRPSAKEQLRILCDRHGLSYMESSDKEAPLDSLARLKDYLRVSAHDCVIIDTAGRTSIDEVMLDELNEVYNFLRQSFEVSETLLVIDGLTGQSAVRTAESFAKVVPTTGYILTRMDGDGRGGAALSLGYQTKKPIVFLGVGEDISGLESFDAERLSDRILDKGDVVALVEEIGRTAGKEELEDSKRRLERGIFDLSDIEKQLLQVAKMGGVKKMASLLPGQTQFADRIEGMGSEKKIAHQLAVIRAMTAQEKRNSKILNFKRKQRIAKGSGTSIQILNEVIKMEKTMHEVMKMSAGKKSFLSKMMGSIGSKAMGAGGVGSGLGGDLQSMLQGGFGSASGNAIAAPKNKVKKRRF